MNLRRKINMIFLKMKQLYSNLKYFICGSVKVMADIKWIKLATGMPDDERMKLIDEMPERDTVHYLWIRLLIQAAKTNADGAVFLSEDMPYTDTMLAVIFSRPLTSIKLALKTLSRLGMIEIDSDKIIRIVNWDKHQNIEGMERVREQNRKRAEAHREKKKSEKNATKSNKEETYKDEALEEDIYLGENKDLDEKEALENLETSEEAYENAVIDDKTNTDTNESVSNISVETANNCTVTKNTSNVTQNKSNVIVTKQNKKEIENKKKNKNEKKEIDKDKNIESNKNNACDLNNKTSACDKAISESSQFEQHNNTKNEAVEGEDINLKALELMRYHEKITGKVGGCDYVALRAAIDIHGEKWVKMAMDVSFEKNCPDIKYAIGILKNWRREGYPEDKVEVKKNGFRSAGKNSTADKNEFTGFKPKEPRKLTEAKRKWAEANLI
jgi:predicted phage replisome organizer